MNIITYNTPFTCMNNCPGCYLKKTMDMSNIDMIKGMSNLSTLLVADKKATLVIAMMNNRKVYEHVDILLKKTKHLRKYRETHILANVEGYDCNSTGELFYKWNLDEISLSCDIDKYEKAISLMAATEAMANRKIRKTVITVLDRQNPEELVSKIKRAQATGIIDEFHLLPLIDAGEVTKMERTNRFLPTIMKLTLENPTFPVHLTGCVSCFGTDRCPGMDNGYLEITGRDIQRVCPYGVQKECGK